MVSPGGNVPAAVKNSGATEGGEVIKKLNDVNTPAGKGPMPTGPSDGPANTVSEKARSAVRAVGLALSRTVTTNR
jgi:hypothetical protein